MKTNSYNKTYHMFFSKLASPLRIEIISLLAKKENEKGMSVKQIMSGLWIEQSKLSHALAELRKCNLVIMLKKGKERIYSLNKKTLLPILKLIDEHSSSYCNGNCACCSKHQTE